MNNESLSNKLSHFSCHSFPRHVPAQSNATLSSFSKSTWRKLDITDHTITDKTRAWREVDAVVDPKFLSHTEPHWIHTLPCIHLRESSWCWLGAGWTRRSRSCWCHNLTGWPVPPPARSLPYILLLRRWRHSKTPPPLLGAVLQRRPEPSTASAVSIVNTGDFEYFFFCPQISLVSYLLYTKTSRVKNNVKNGFAYKYFFLLINCLCKKISKKYSRLFCSKSCFFSFFCIIYFAC